jgi:hypothetical protein
MIIRHPMWCRFDGGGQSSGEDYQWEGPAEDDGMHRARAFHVESGDMTLTVGLAQPFETSEDRLIDVAPPVVEFTMHDHAFISDDTGTWLAVAEAELLAKMLLDVARALRHGPNLPEFTLPVEARP